MAKTYLQSLLAENENIVLVTRKHWFVYLRSVLVEILLIIILAVVTLLLTFLIPLISPWVIVLISVCIFLVPILGGVRDFLIWWNQQYIITNRRVIQVSGVFNKNVTDSSLEKVNDVKMEQSVLGRLFNYGDIEILTASELGANLFHLISQPVRFKTSMLNAKAELEHIMSSPGANHQAEEEDIPSMIAELDNLRQKGILSEAEFQTKKAELLKKM